MGAQHLLNPIVKQGNEIMGCWAAVMSWYGKTVRNLNHTMLDVAGMYSDLMDTPPPGCQIGGMGDSGRKHVFMDSKWRLNQTWVKRDEMSVNFIDMYLETSPIIFCYYDPKLANGRGGSHVNAIVARVPFTESKVFVMEPDPPSDWNTYVVRDLMYYTGKFSLFHLASMRGFN